MTSHAGWTIFKSGLNVLHVATIQRASRLMFSFDGIVEVTSDVATDDKRDPQAHTSACDATPPVSPRCSPILPE